MNKISCETLKLIKTYCACPIISLFTTCRQMFHHIQFDNSFFSRKFIQNNFVKYIFINAKKENSLNEF